MLKIYSAQNLPEAYLLVHLLAQAGIEARVFNENLQGALGNIPFPEAYPQVWLLRENDAARARQVLGEYERRPAQRGTLRCRECGEENPDNFQICWNCARAL
jgi:putative signal transducing protein